MSNDIEWKMIKLGDVCQIKDGTHQTPHYVENGKQFYSVENVTNNDFSHTKYISESEHKKLTATYRIEKGDVLMTRIGSIGVCKYIDWDVDASFYVSLALLKCNKTFINPRYFVFYSQTKQFREEILSHSLQFAIPMKINLGKISDVLISIPYKNGSPDLETQKQIAQKLGDMDSLIAAKEKLLAKKRNLKVAAMQKLIKDEEGENWKKVKIGDYLRVKTGSKNTEDKIDDGKYPLYVRSPIVERINEYTHDCEAVLTAGDGVGTGKVFHYVNGKFAAHQRVYVISNFTEIDGKYFYYQFSQNFYDEVMKYTAKSSVDSVRRGMITGMEIALPFNSDGSPGLIEQRRIASILSDMDCEISAIEKEITKLQNLKTAMIQKMFCFGDSDSSSE